MHRIKRGVLIGFVLFWVLGFLLVAPSPVYRALFINANDDITLDHPVQLFEGIDWAHPYYYQHIGQAFRDLIQQVDLDMVYVFFDFESPHNTTQYIRYFREYQQTWAYPTRVVVIERLTDLDPQDVVIISSMNIPPETLFDCIVGEAHLYLCQV